MVTGTFSFPPVELVKPRKPAVNNWLVSTIGVAAFAMTLAVGLTTWRMVEEPKLAASSAIVPGRHVVETKALAASADAPRDGDLATTLVWRSAERRIAECADGEAGSVVAHVRVDGAGIVRNARVEGEFATMATGPCLQRLLRTLRFPEGRDGRALTFTYEL
jgi:hypothetical protein